MAGERLRLLATCLAAAACIGPGAARAATVPASWDRGFVLTAWWHDEYSDIEAVTALRQIRTTGADSVALIATWYQPTPRSSAMAPDPFRTPSDESIVRIARWAKSLGMKVTLRLVVDLEDGASRTLIEPRLPDLWFETYARMVEHYARLARSAAMDSLQIGVELSGLTDRHEWRWRGVAWLARVVFGGELSYGANWDEYARIRWWDAVDVIAIDAYFPLAPDPRPRSEGQIVRAWTEARDRWGGRGRYLDEVRAVQRRFQRPVIFSEIGYASNPANLVEPWRTGGTYSAAAQVRATRAAIRAWVTEPSFRGMYFWQWRPVIGAGGAGDADHTPQGKPARRAIAAWFGGR